ncbi:MAG: phage Gp37/Gp68 family protein [Rhodanobacteraceae bacterium]|nr:MAG: phage Gp37/Gp68 family protein [Rhodanobacteraceae bacterium]
MSDRSRIEWTDASWNPIRGCSRVSAGCENCYAERQAARFAAKGQPWHGFVRAVNGHPAWTGRTSLIESALDLPLRWRRPRKVFVCSMSDLFHESVSDQWLDEIFQVMASAQRHTFQVLTKRAARMHAYLGSRGFHPFSDDGWTMTGTIGTQGEVTPAPTGRPLPNVWLGVSVENQAAADERIPLLLQTPATVRFLSCEPLLGPIDLRRACALHRWKDADGVECCNVTRSLDWVIVGGESGPRARPMDPNWARRLRDQSKASNVPFFFKQWGEWATGEQSAVGPDHPIFKRIQNRAGRDGTAGIAHAFGEGWTNEWWAARIGRKKAGRLLDGYEYNEFPKGVHPNG